MGQQITARTYTGLFLLTLSTIVFEIVLTRIFSVTMWYHFAFMAISVALFGMAVGAVIVYSLPKKFLPEHASFQLSINSFCFALSVVAAFLVHLHLPFTPEWTARGVASVMATYAVIAVPFIFSGTAVCVALTRFPARVSGLYAVDLVGAALGCVLIILMLRVGDAPSVIFAVAAMAALAAFCFALEVRARKLMAMTMLCVVGFGIFSAYAARRAQNQDPVFWFQNVKARLDRKPSYQLWNHHSYLAVQGEPGDMQAPLGWGVSPTWPKDKLIDQIPIVIDAVAGTAMTHYTGKPEEIEYLRYDVVNLAHQIRHDSNVLVIGVGGGRDILSALAFNQKSVTGVEINTNMLQIVNGPYAEYTGHIGDLPNVKLVGDEARSYVARSDRKFNIIQVSLIDSFAATAAGAFVLTENSLYTREAWNIFLNHLEPNGVLTFSRWYYQERPYEMWRLTALATEALRDQGVTNIADHMIIVRSMFRWGDAHEEGYSIGTMLVSKEAFTPEDVKKIEDVVKQMEFEIVLSPNQVPPADNVLTQIITTDDLDSFTKNFEINIEPPTDDSPFFFHVIRLKDFFNEELLNQGTLSFNNKAITTLMLLVITVVVLSTLFVMGPLLIVGGKVRLASTWPFFVYFGGIGLGFMFIEISQMQRLVIFLGHPTYSLSVVLFSVLLSSGIGSYFTSGITRDTLARAGGIRLGSLVVILVLFGLLTPTIVHQFEHAGNLVRITLAVLLLFPVGFFMGMAFPLGMKLAERKDELALTPWLWGVNGSMSVCSSVLSVAIALIAGISAAFWTGVVCYVVTLAVFMILNRKR